jgi:hypothetical protein
MNRDDSLRFARLAESLVSPQRAAEVAKGAAMLGKLPVSLQKRIIAKASKKDPYIGFIVEPYSLFLSFEVSEEAAKAVLPKGYKILPTSLYADSPGRPCAILGVFNVRTSVFWGARAELYLIAERESTGMLSWIIQEYETNAISLDPGRGLSAPSLSRASVTTTYRGDFFAELAKEDGSRPLELSASLRGAPSVPLNQRLWVEGNLSVDYGDELHDGKAEAFGLVFDPGEMAEAQRLDPDFVSIKSNAMGSGLIGERPFEVCCFPFAQHFMTTSLPVATGMKGPEDLERAVSALAASYTD